MLKRGMWTGAVVGTVLGGLVAASPALALQVTAEQYPGETDISVGLIDWGSQGGHDITVRPDGFVLGKPTSVVITDSRAALEYYPEPGRRSYCQILSAHKAKCTHDQGIDAMTASLMEGTGDTLYRVLPGPLGAASVMAHFVGTGSGDDQVTIPNGSVGVLSYVDTYGGDDTVVAPFASVNCGDGNDTAIGYGETFPSPPTNCEHVVPL